MIVSSGLDYKSTGRNLHTTTELNLKSFLTPTYKLSESEIYYTNIGTVNGTMNGLDQKELDIDEYSNETKTDNDAFDIKSSSKKENENQSLKEDEKEKEELLSHYFKSSKDNNANKIFCDRRQNIFQVNYRIRNDFKEIDNDLLSELSNEKIFLNDKVLPKIKRRRENLDNILKKIKTNFFNNYLYKKINEILKSKQNKLYFVKFPISFVNDIKLDTNRELINITLLEIISNKDIYNEKDLNNYYHNLKVIENEEINKNEELKEILNKKYFELFEEYINSKEFNIDEIKRLKNNNMDNIYIERYIYQSKNFIEYYS